MAEYRTLSLSLPLERLLFLKQRGAQAKGIENVVVFSVGLKDSLVTSQPSAVERKQAVQRAEGEGGVWGSRTAAVFLTISYFPGVP